MAIVAQARKKANGDLAAALAITGLATGLFIIALLRMFGVPLFPLAVLGGATVLLWLMWRHLIAGLGLCLAFMPLLPLMLLIARFLGVSRVSLGSGYMGAGLLLLTYAFILWKRNGIKFTTPDWFLFVCFALATIRFVLDGMLVALLSDFGFMGAYAIGRVTVLTEEQQDRWAGRAVWIVAFLSVLGLIEVLVIGEGPRTILYLATTEGATEGTTLNNTFHAGGYLGLRESSTMFGPLTFGLLCMVGLIVWWVYRRNPLPAALIGLGLLASLTRSAWVGTIVAITVLAFAMAQKKRLLQYGALGLLLFAVSVPFLGLSDYLFATRTGEDPSAEGHKESLIDGLRYISDHPFGAGPGNAGSYAAKNNANAISFEGTYLQLSTEYGMLTTLCFLGFLVSALRSAWRLQTRLGYSATAILAGFGTAIVFAALHQDLPLQSWIWFPVGLAIRSSESASKSSRIPREH